MPNRRSALGRGQRAAMAATLVFMVVSAIVVAAWSTVWPDDPGMAFGRPTHAEALPEGTRNLDDVDPRSVADNLFNHVVQAAADGDSLQLRTYLPAALQAYSVLGTLDADALFHVATLQRVASDPDASLTAALRILESDEEHLLGLGAAAVAADEAGDAATANAFYSRFSSAFEREMARSLPEYVGHASFLGRVRAEGETRAAGP